jgi:hypothetical protein
MLLRNTLLSAAGASLVLALASTASAAPMSQVTTKSATAASTVEGQATQVGWRHRRHCHWHKGHRHCKMRRVWVPGVHIHIGKSHRHRHRHHH